MMKMAAVLIFAAPSILTKPFYNIVPGRAFAEKLGEVAESCWYTFDKMVLS